MPVPLASRHSSPVIKKPEITKNTSTPTKPPPIPGSWAWNSTTANTATARRPSMSGRNRESRRSPGRPSAGMTLSVRRTEPLIGYHGRITQSAKYHIGAYRKIWETRFHPIKPRVGERATARVLACAVRC